jgi:hypothetical protein
MEGPYLFCKLIIVPKPTLGLYVSGDQHLACAQARTLGDAEAGLATPRRAWFRPSETEMRKKGEAFAWISGWWENLQVVGLS